MSSTSEPNQLQIPPLDVQLIPENVKLPKKLWERIYTLLSEAPNRSLTQHDLVLAYSKKFKESLGGKDFLSKCRVRSINLLICALPDVEPIKMNGVTKYTLRRPEATYSRYTYRDKVEKMEAKSTKVEDDEDFGDETDTEDEIDESDEDSNEFNIPKQPPEMIPENAKMPEVYRRQIYKLLSVKYRKGVELNTFRQAFTKYYSCSISNLRDCHMGYEEMFYCLTDILEIERDEGGKLWLRPRTIEEIRKLHIERPSDIFCIAPVFREFEEKREQKKQKTSMYKRRPYHPSTVPKPPTMKNSQWRNGFVPVQQFENGFDDHPSTSGASKLSDSDTSFTDAVNEKKIFNDNDNYNQQTFSKIVKPDLKSIDIHQEPSNWPNNGSNWPNNGPTVNEGRSAHVNSAAMDRLVRSNQRINEARDGDRRRMASDHLANLQTKKFEDKEETEFYEATTSAKGRVNIPQEKGLEVQIYEAMKPYNDWLAWDYDLYDIYERKYGFPLNIPSSLGRSVIDVLEQYPEMFAFNGQHSVMARPPPIFSCPVLSLQSILDFGIEAGDVFHGSFKKLQLVKGELLQVLVPNIKENGDFYVQLTSMESAFSDMDIDMNAFYTNPFNNEKYIMHPDLLQPNLPVAAFVHPDWRRAVVITVDGENVFINLVDFGQNLWIDRKFLRLLRCVFVEDCVTPCAVQVGLDGVVPDLNKPKTRISEMIHNTIKDAARMSIVVKSIRAEDGAPLVELRAHFGPNLPRVVVNDEVVRLGLATLAVSDQPSTSRAASIANFLMAPVLNPKSAPINDLDKFHGPETTTETPQLVNANRFSDSDSSTSDNIESARKYGPVSLINLDEPGSTSATTSSANVNQNHPIQEPIPNSNDTNDVDPELIEIAKLLSEKLNDRNLSDDTRLIYHTQVQAILKGKPL